jgi:hypothetical protein
LLAGHAECYPGLAITAIFGNYQRAQENQGDW